jgi:excinuclease ABC subunit C
VVKKRRTNLKIRKADIPEKPGVYMFKAGDNILYIGKAKNLKKRVDQYFQKRDHGMVHSLIQQAGDIEYIVTDDEKDALLLEYNLVHRFRPPFNIRLKDDKSFPLIQFTTSQPFPAVYFSRFSGPAKNKNTYVGPIVDARKTKELIDLVTRVFKLRTCSDKQFNRQTACLYFYIDRCSAPCIDNIAQQEYLKNVNDAIALLEGNKKNILSKMHSHMNRLAEQLKFEEAQKVKEDIALIERFTIESYISTTRETDYDVIAFHYDPVGDHSFIILFSILEGRVKRKEFFNFNAVSSQPGEILKEFMVSFYGSENIPREILTQIQPDDGESLETMFSQMAGHKIKIKFPHKGPKRKMMNMAIKNLNLYVNKHNYDLVGKRLEDALHLSRVPHVIEGFDISHLSERDRVGAAVVFANGAPVKKKYRSYIIKKAPPGDTEALKEVLERRFKNRPPEEHPDLLLIDGGKGQLSAALAVKEKLDIQSDVIALAKREERVFMENGESMLFPEDSPERFLLQDIRDEVHRRAVTHHKKRRDRLP